MTAGGVTPNSSARRALIGVLLFLDELPDGFQIIFARDAGFFAAA